MKKTIIMLVIVLSVLSIVLTVATYLAPHLGWGVYTVASGSMEPALKTGSVIVTCPVEAQDIVIDDIILFYPPFGTDNMVTHRVIETGDDAYSDIFFRTQGDANLNPDPFKVYPDSLIGRICWNITGAGGFFDFVKSTAGFITLVVGPTVLILAAYVYSVWRVFSESQKKKAHTGH